VEHFCDVILLTYFRGRNLFDVIKMTPYVTFRCLTVPIFKNVNWPNHATSDQWDKKKVSKLSDILSFS